MIDLIERHRAELEELCRKHKVKTLEVFGSAADGNWKPETSDLDFLVDYLPRDDGKSAHDYFELLHDLEDLFVRKIDLVMVAAIRNKYFLQGVNRSRRVIYAA
jgi:predicted nucleotidyltransferase